MNAPKTTKQMMVHYSSIILSTIRVGEDEDISNGEYRNAERSIHIFFLLWDHPNPSYGNLLKGALIEKLNQVNNKKRKRTYILSIVTIEQFLIECIKAKESP